MADFFACTRAHLEAYEAARAARSKHYVVVYNYAYLDQGRGQTPEEVEAEMVCEHERTVAESLARLQEAQGQLRADRVKLDEVAATQGALETAADAVKAALDLDAQTRPPAADVPTLAWDRLGRCHKPRYAGFSDASPPLKRALLDLRHGYPLGWPKQGSRSHLKKYLKKRGVWRELVERAGSEPRHVERLLGFLPQK